MRAFVFFTISILLIVGCAKEQNINIDSKNRANKPFETYSDSNFKSKAIAYINSIRQKGAPCAPFAPPLRLNSHLEAAANAHAKDMAINNFLKHTGSGTIVDIAKPSNGVGSLFFERIIFFGYPVKPKQLTGENITYTKIKVVGTKDEFTHFKRAVNNLIADPPHCVIFMNPRFQDVGIGLFKTDKRYYWVLDFAEAKK